jgi:hypothetical protein
MLKGQRCRRRWCSRENLFGMTKSDRQARIRVSSKMVVGSIGMHVESILQRIHDRKIIQKSKDGRNASHFLNFVEQFPLFWRSIITRATDSVVSRAPIEQFNIENSVLPFRTMR